MALELGLPAAEVLRVRLAAALHDVGKMAIPEAILEKPGPLSEHERLFVNRHTLIGARILHAAPDLSHLADVVRSSHERMDGKGYPDGLPGRRDPARLAHHLRLRRLRRHDLRALVRARR